MLNKMGSNKMKAKQINDGLITYQAIDKNNIPRVWGCAETFMEAKNQCEELVEEIKSTIEREPRTSNDQNRV